MTPMTLKNSCGGSNSASEGSVLVSRTPRCRGSGRGSKNTLKDQKALQNFENPLICHCSLLQN